MLGDFKTSAKNQYPVDDRQLTHVFVLLEIGANIACTEIRSRVVFRSDLSI